MLRQKQTQSGRLNHSGGFNKARGLAAAFGLAIIVSHFPNMLKAKTIATFEDSKVLQDWAVVNDTVMGGVSQSTFKQTDEGNLLFTGELSLANNGGFVSIRNRARQLGIGDAREIALRVRGDGRTYYLDLRSSRQQMAGSFRAAFTTVENDWQEVAIPLDKFVAQSFGRPLRNVKLDPSTITSIGFTLSDKIPGPFQLEIESVKSVEVESGNGPSVPLLLSPTIELAEKKLGLIDLAIEKGVPLFNDGSPAACAAIYEVACTGLIAMPGTPDPILETLRRALDEIKVASSDRQKAWILRYALDETVVLLRQ